MHAKKILNRTTANVTDIESIVGSIRPNLSGTSSLSARAKRSYFWFAEMAARGFVSVRAPMGAHAHLQYLAFGQTKSVSTFRRSVSELEQHGYVRRRKCVRGDVAVIDLDVDRFKFYIQRNRRFKPTPCGTFTHTYVPQSNCPPDDLTKSYSFNNQQRSIDVTTSMKSKKNAKKKKGYGDWIHPLVFTIGIICYDMGKKQREKLQQAALRAISDGIEPFSYWTAERWQTMSVPVREKTARNLLPELEGIAERYEKARSEYRRREKEKPKPKPEIPDYLPLPELKVENFDPWFQEFATRMDISISGKSPPKKNRNKKGDSESPGLLLTPEEYRLMAQAKLNCKQKRG